MANKERLISGSVCKAKLKSASGGSGAAHCLEQTAGLWLHAVTCILPPIREHPVWHFDQGAVVLGFFCKV